MVFPCFFVMNSGKGTFKTDKSLISNRSVIARPVRRLVVAIPIEFPRRVRKPSYDTLLKTIGDSHVAALLGMTVLFKRVIANL